MPLNWSLASKGDWCPEAAESLENCWRKIVGDDGSSCTMPCASTMKESLPRVGWKSGRDYENDLGKVLSKNTAAAFQQREQQQATKDENECELATASSWRSIVGDN
jgi:hypothetical protein